MSRLPSAVEPRFNRDIRPILADRCYACHGPDSGTRKADLRLDTQEGATESVDRAGRRRQQRTDLAASRATTPTCGCRRRESKKPPLTAEQVELLRKWINAGAKYEPHWAYIPPQRPAGAATSRSKVARGPRNDIDRFLLAKHGSARASARRRRPIA